MQKEIHTKAIVRFISDDPRSQNHSKSLFFSIEVQFIIPHQNVVIHNCLKEPIFENRVLLTHYENDIERLNTFYSIFDLSKEDQTKKIIGFFSNKKFESFQPYSHMDENELNFEYFYVSAFRYPCVSIYFVENHFFEINEDKQKYTTQDSKRIFKIGEIYKTTDGKQGIFSRNDKNQIESIFKFQTWYKKS